MSAQDEIRREAARYLGYRKNAPDQATLRLIDQCLGELEAACTPRHVYAVHDLSREGDCLHFAGITLKSRDLWRHLSGCARVILFAATLGAPADRLLLRDQSLDMSRAVVLQACCAALIEDYCDRSTAQIAEAERLPHLTARFSPGYGDLALSCQPALLRALAADRAIGLSVTQSCMLTPTKSVTALIGVCDGPVQSSTGCAACQKNDCTFRKGV